MIVVLQLSLLAATTGIMVAVARDTESYSGRIFPGVSISGVPVGGLTLEQAKTAADAIAASRLSRAFTLKVQDERFGLTFAELGLVGHVNEAVTDAYGMGRRDPWLQMLFTRIVMARHPVDIPIRYTWTPESVLKVLTPMAGEIKAEPQNAVVTVEGGKVVITQESRNGRTLDLAATGARIRNALGTDIDEVEAVVQVTEPDFTTDEARELAAPLVQFSTKIPGTENRVHNIALAASYISGTILAPGEVFSYNKIVGPRTAERGFKEAPVLIDDELVPGDGGGVCQVSSTLFNVALLADFDIAARTNHSRPVPYLPIGRDATVSYNAFDLQFRNTTGHHVMLWAWVTDRRLTMMAFGTQVAGKEVRIEVSEFETITPPEGTVTKHDPALDDGEVVTRDPLPGYRVRTYRVVTVNGEVVRRELIDKSVYRPVARTIKIGTKKAKKVIDERS